MNVLTERRGEQEKGRIGDFYYLWPSKSGL
jgi:hypothetical protein